ncbi:MAG: hypothetical protein IMW89_20935 [Ktedonobacteraceae bacterium]|nr:hypothetical protein [Ktedonobacteraceae bacterium]
MANEQTSKQRTGASPGAGSPTPKKKSRADKTKKPQIGGTAVPGAKSTQPRPMPTGSDPARQELASYNRDMRRRMQHIAAGPYGEDEQMERLQAQRKKRIERRKERMEKKRQEAVKSLPKINLSLGRRNTYFLIAAAALVVLLIAAFVILRLTHIV